MNNRVSDLREVVDVNSKHVNRLNRCLVGGFSALLVVGDAIVPEEAAAGGSAQPQHGGNDMGRQISGTKC